MVPGSINIITCFSFNCRSSCVTDFAGFFALLLCFDSVNRVVMVNTVNEYDNLELTWLIVLTKLTSLAGLIVYIVDNLQS